MKRDEIEIGVQLSFLYWALVRIQPLHPSDGQNCDIGLEIGVLWWALLHSQAGIKKRLKLLEKAVKAGPMPDFFMKEGAIGKEIKTLRWVVQEGGPPPFFFISNLYQKSSKCI